jgi:hypothetical protein
LFLAIFWENMFYSNHHRPCGGYSIISLNTSPQFKHTNALLFQKRARNVVHPCVNMAVINSASWFMPKHPKLTIFTLLLISTQYHCRFENEINLWTRTYHVVDFVSSQCLSLNLSSEGTIASKKWLGLWFFALNDTFYTDPWYQCIWM